MVSDAGTVVASATSNIDELRHSSTQLLQLEIGKIIDKSASDWTDAAKTTFEAMSHINKGDDSHINPDGTHVDPFTLPPAPLYSFPITPMDYGFLTGSSQVKVEIANALAEQEILGWKLLAAHCRTQCEIWDKQLGRSTNSARHSRRNPRSRATNTRYHVQKSDETGRLQKKN